MRCSIPVLIVLAALAVTSAVPPHGLPACVHGNFAGITQTLADGTIVGEPDAGDWGCVRGGGTSDAIQRTPGRRTAPHGAADVPAPPPTAVCLQPAAPNPAEVATRLEFTLPAGAQVSLIVYGRRQGHGPRETFVARTLVDASLAAGIHSVIWNLNDDQGARVEPGIYRAVLVVGDEALCGDIDVR